MISPEIFLDLLTKNGTDFFAGVPDSLLKNFCACVTDCVPAKNHIIAANEGCALALAAGHHFATGTIPCVYMQNSGEGNMINPLLSLVDSAVYSVPALLIIGWRGEPGVPDEPQHRKQGEVTLDLLLAMKIPFEILEENPEKLPEQIARIYAKIRENSAPAALVVRKGIFEKYSLKNAENVAGTLSREQAIEQIMLGVPANSIFVSTTGMASRELYELREKHHFAHEKDFLTVGSMGHASQIALAIALERPNRSVICLDGDGAALMHMGGLATIGSISPKNFVHIVLNNGAHDSVGGQPTIARKIDLCGIAKSCGYENVVRAGTPEEIANAISSAISRECLTFIEIFVRKGARADLGRPKTTPIENKIAFMNFLKE